MGVAMRQLGSVSGNSYNSKMDMLRRCAPVTALIAVFLTIPLVLGYWGSAHPALDSFAHFRLHLSAFIAVLALPSLMDRRWASISFALLLLAIAATASTLANPSGVAIANASAHIEEAGPARYKLLQMNLRYDNPQPKDVLSLIARHQPDVITLDEVSDYWREELKFIEHAYPHQIICTGTSHIGGVAILSRRPFLHPSQADCLSRGSLAIATVNFSGSAVDIGAIHLGWPWPHGQHWHAGRIEPILKSRLGSSAILAGDLNAVWWSHTARMIANAGELKSLGNIGPTWLFRGAPDFLRRYAGLPIDNLFFKGRVVPASVKRLPTTGSDHLPVLLEFGIVPVDEQPSMQVRTRQLPLEIKKAG